MSSTVFQELLETLTHKEEELKETRKEMKSAEKDVSIELEEKKIVLRDLKKEVKAMEEDHLRQLLQDNVEYAENRERVQLLKEECAQAKLELFTAATNASRERGVFEEMIMVNGAPTRLQTQQEVGIYLNGKVLKAA